MSNLRNIFDDKTPIANILSRRLNKESGDNYLLKKQINSAVDITESHCDSCTWLKTVGCYDIVKLHKQKLGPQDRTDVLGSESRRFWCWNLTLQATIIVNNSYGVEMYVSKQCTAEGAIELWELYLERVYGEKL